MKPTVAYVVVQTFVYEHIQIRKESLTSFEEITIN